MDHIQHLLAQTGWSCEDLMKKLSEFKQKNNSDSSNCIAQGTFLTATTSNGYEPKNNGHQEELIENKPEISNTSIENCDNHNNSEEININDKKCDDDCIDVETSDLVTDENVINKSLETVRTSISIVDRLKNKLDNNGKKDLESLPKAKNMLLNNVQVTKKPNREKQKTFDHTYIRTKRKLRRDMDPTSPRNISLRKIRTVRKNCFLLRSRHRQRLSRKLNKINRKLLIVQYKRPEMVRSEILKQLELLRSRKPNFELCQTININNPFVNKKRYLPTKVKNGFFEPKPSCSSSSFDHFEGTGIFELPGDSLNIVKHDLIEETGVEIDSSIEMIDYNYPDDAQKEIGIKNIIIADVRGGCEILENSKTQEKEDAFTNILSDTQGHTIKPTKTSDITKIKGWKTKIFKIADKADKVTNESSDSNPAFASSDLDGFLATACVDINFKVPAVLPPPEQQSMGPIFIPQTKQDESEGDIQHADATNVYRPRKRIMKLKYDNKGKRETQKPRTLAEKRRLLGSIVQKRVKHVAKPTGDNTAYSYVLYRGKRLKVRTKTQNDVIAHVKTTYGKRDYIYVPKKPRNFKAKPSIFKNTFCPTTTVLKYRPGPLCKKANLQFENQNWSTVIKKLPEVTLGIVPQYKKPIDPKIVHLLPKYDFDITPDRVEFALTALKPKDNTVNLFEIKVPYQNNQEEIVLRTQTEEIIPEIKVPEEASIDDTCKTVIGKMLDYLEIKEISDEVIKNDVNTQLLSEDKFECKQAATTTTKRKKQSKTNYELKRLNVKVIEVNLEEKEDIKDCKKDFCLLGCICNSLSTTSSLLANHCGRPDCMFECECNYQRKSKGNVKVTLPIGTDLLSEGAVNRLEVEAKKNLARVEKEFTQTVIQANNQTIVVGGCTNRQRRVTKLPKKYNDYIEDPEILVIEEENTEPPPEKPVNDVDNWKPRECSVCLQKLRLDQVIPFCLVHNLYDCHCKYEAEFPILKTPTNKDELNSESTDNTPDPQEVETIIITSQPSNITKEILENNQISKTTNKVKIMPYFTEQSYFTERFEINYCARTRGIPTQYYMVRNRTERFITTRDRKFLRDISKLNFDVEQDPIPAEAVNMNNRNKRRKQELVVKEDVSEVRVKKTNPRKVRKKPPDEPNLKSFDTTAILKFLQLFPNARKDHNYFSPSPDIKQKFLSLLARKEGTIFYLLQWQVLATGYQKNAIQLWYSTYFKVPKIVITDSTMLPKYFTNIKKYEKVSNKDQIKNDIIRALVTGTVPGGNSKDDMQVILELSQIYCQVHGTIKKNQDKQENLFLTTETHKSSPKIVNVESLSESKEQPNSTSSDESLLTKDNGNASIKPNLPIVRKIMFKKHIFLKQNLSTVTKDGESTELIKVTAHLPVIKDGCLWRMIKLNSDFNVLSLTRNCYSIKYSDIQKVLKMAMEKSMTIVLKTEVVSKNYPHKDFGIYVSPNVENAFFVGPYYELECHDISTFRYLNRELIRTEAFNKMKGLAPVINGAWLKQCTEEDTNDKGLTIDLTESDHEDTPVIQESTEKLLFNLNDFDYFEFTAENYASNQSLIDDDVSTNVPTTSGNIYFLTNVATLGFILGHKLSGDNVLVRWPTFNSVLKFKTYSNAVKFLQREMAATFIQAPGFNITITISTENTGTIFNPNYLKGYYIVSEDGLTNVLDVTKTTLSQLKFTKQQLEDLVKQRACKLVYDNCYEVAKSLFSTHDLQLRGNTTSLVNMMQKEIKKLEQQNVEYLNALESLSNSKADVLSRFDKRCEELWPHVTDKFKSKLIEVLRSHGRSINIPEKRIQTDDIICIDIDDEEDEPQQPIEINSEPTHSLTVEKLPIYTKNPSMIITANINDRPAVEIVAKVPSSESKPKLSIKSVKDLIAQQPVVNEKSVLKDQLPASKSTIKPRKYLLKTSTGAVIEIQADQYKKLRAQSSKAAKGQVAVRRKLAPLTLKEKDDQAVLTKLSTSQLRKLTLKQTTVPGGCFVKIVNSPPKATDVSKSCSSNSKSDVGR